ncbi:MAG: protein kinase [Kofleriaceae bacterium]
MGGSGEPVSASGSPAAPTGHIELGPGSMVGEYRIEGMLGEGGMGRVYSATHPVIAKRAAVKVLHPELSMHREAVERFIQEARSVNQIGHPNIVDIFAFGTLPDGRCYFVMEWLRGESLRTRIERGLLPLAHALGFLETVMIALEAAHENGIVHRDLKPDNIFLVEIKGTEPQVKLLDFGIAKLLGNDNARAERTRTGNLLGTPAYISPEQARGHLVDHRTDIYAAGALAYELFTGELPFPADNAADMIAKHLFAQPPSAIAKNPQVPPPLDMMVMRMLAKEAAHRPTLAEVRDELRRAMQFVTARGVAEHGGGGVPAQGTAPGAYSPVGAMPTPSTATTGDRAASYGHPTPASAYAMQAPGMHSVTTSPPAAKSRAPLAIIGGLIAIVVGTGVFVAARGNRAGDSAKPSAIDTPVTAPPAPARPTDVAPAAAAPPGPVTPEPPTPEPPTPEPPAPEPPTPTSQAVPPERPARSPALAPPKPAKPARAKPRKARPIQIEDRDAAM